MRSIPIASALLCGAVMAPMATSAPALASSHMDAPLITYDDPANTTDVYAFVSQGETGVDYLTTALAVYPFEEPGIGPNNYSFDPRVRYEIHVALGNDIALGEKTISYQFDFETEYAEQGTILQSFLGVLDPNPTPGGFPFNQNLRQTYTVTMVDHRTGTTTVLGEGAEDGLIVPPNNQGLVTPFYNRRDDGDRRARRGVSRESRLDPYTASAIAELGGGYRSFAGQRDDGFYADIQSIFDLDFTFTGRRKPFDSQGGFNVHTIVFNIPLDLLNGEPLAGVFATTSREILTESGETEFVQVGRQGNPLFAEALVAIEDKDLYNTSDPTIDDAEFGIYADSPELSALFGVQEILPGLIRSIFIPDLIKVDLTTGPARLAGEDGFSRLGVFGGDTPGEGADVLLSTAQDPFGNGGFIPGGWPNGRRFGDDVVDIAVIALGLAGPADLTLPGLGFAGTDIDGVTANDITYNDVFPYAATPLNGRNHPHHRVANRSDRDDRGDDDHDDDDN